MRTNPNPLRISDALWWLINMCTDDTPTSFVDEHGGVWVRQPGSHADAGWLKLNRPNDYSLRGPLQQNGPQNFGRAWDWTFPSAQAGNYDAIVKYSSRIRKAWESNDPRTFGIFEVLCEADNDYDPEGYVFYPTKSFRVPDRTHKWHIHLGILTTYIADMEAMDAIWSIFSGETLTEYHARKNPVPDVGGEDTMEFVYASGRGWALFSSDRRVFNGAILTQDEANAVARVLGRSARVISASDYDTFSAILARMHPES